MSINIAVHRVIGAEVTTYVMDGRARATATVLSDPSYYGDHPDALPYYWETVEAAEAFAAGVEEAVRIEKRALEQRAALAPVMEPAE